jgi:hypothetical protein
MGLVVAGALAPHAAAQPAPITLPARFSYAAKFLCGVSSATTTAPPREPIVKRGNYATVVNIHNPYATDVVLIKKVALAAPERYPDTRLIAPTKRFKDVLHSDHTMSVDCTEIVNLLTLNGTPPATPFIEGFLVVDSFLAAATTASPADIDVVTVTTIAQSATGAVVDHEIEAVAGKRLAAGTWQF